MTARQQALEQIQHQSVITASEFRAWGFHKALLTKLSREGVLERVDRGVYLNPAYPITEHHSLVEATARLRMPAVVCLLSALRFHELGTQDPAEIWLAIERPEGITPRLPATWQPLRLTRWDPQHFAPGQEQHTLEGRQVSVYNVAKTLVDCFWMRNQTGLDVFLEALSDAWRNRRFTMDELLRYASLGERTVTNEIRPYLESLTA